MKETARTASTATPQGADALFDAVYQRLKAMAGHQLAQQRRDTLNTTALVHELYLRLSEHPVAKIHSRAHFFALAARAMRQIVVDHARRRASQKRGGSVDVTDIDAALGLGEQGAEEALDLDAALSKLEVRDADLARVV